MLSNTLEIDGVDFALLQDDMTFQDTTFHDFESSEQFMDSCLLPGSMDWDALQFFDTEDTAPISSSEDTMVEAPSPLYIDPRLLTGHIDFEDLAETDLEKPTAAVEEAYFDEIVSQTVPTMPPELLIDGVDFVRFFSKINVSTNQVLAQKGYHKDQLALARSFYVCHSQDPVTSWVFSCKHAEFGCPYQNSFYGGVLEHQRTCNIRSPEAFIESSKVKAFPCDRSGCKRTFDSQGRLTAHIKESHEWKPRSCDKEGCDPKVLFQSNNEFKRHGEKKHSPYTPSRCQFPGCSSEVAYATAMTYRHHLGTHGLSDRKEKDKYMPEKKLTGKKPAFVPQKCQVPGCISTATHTQPSKLRDHLAKKHDYQADEIEDYLSLHRG